MTTAHTATPIKTTPNGLTIVTDSHIGSQRFIATAENKKDAARIVAAWNAHDDLVEALNALLEQTVDQDLAHGIELTEGEQEARAQALAALAKAGAA